VIAATNVDLEEAIREKTFREDLFYRLNVVQLEIPPLRARAEDIPLLAEHYVEQLNPELRLSPAVLRQLQAYHWPGNVRELVNVIRRAAVLCPGDMILPQHLGSALFNAAPTAESPAVRGIEAPTDRPASLDGFWEHYGKEEVLEKMSAGELHQMLHSLRGLESGLLTVMRKRGLCSPASQGLKETEVEMIKKALEQHRWNITETAKALGIARNTLHRKIKAFDLRTD
jgi:two-component system NtrC family response regulator